MVERDVIVGLVAIGVGLTVLVHLVLRRAASEPPRLYSLRVIDDRLGPVGGKIFLALLGIGLTAIGLFLMIKLPSADKFIPPTEQEGVGNVE